MSHTRSGKTLEILTCILEKSLTTQESKIIPRHKLKDADGIMREIDLFVETKVNNKIFCYAFECKDHKKGIQLSHITDFYSKIDRLGIRGFFVTTSNYQSGAISKANALHIELLSLKERKPDPDDIKGLYTYHKQFKIEEARFFGVKDGTGTEIFQQEMLHCTTCKKNMAKVVDKEILPLIINQLDEITEQVHPMFKNINQMPQTFFEKNAKPIGLFVEFIDASLRHQGQQIPYIGVLVNFKVWTDIQSRNITNTTTFNYLTQTDNNILAAFSMSEFFIEDQQLMACVTRQPNGKRTMSIGPLSQQQAIQPQEMICFGKIDEKAWNDIMDAADQSRNCE